MPVLAVGCFAGAGAIAILLAATRGSTAFIAACVVGLVLGLASELPTLRRAVPGARAAAAGVVFGPAMLLGAYVVQSRSAVPLEAMVACLPIGLFAALVPLVGDVPPRAGDVVAGRRALRVPEPKWRVAIGFDLPAVAGLTAIAVGVGTGVLPIPALLALLAFPLVPGIHRGIVRFHDNRYGLVPYMAATIRLHMAVGLLLFAGYAVTLADKALTGMQPFLWR
jgi:1,4-dihydroxy-2-naphthoate octaprenyltransferase